jgi:hypothetical protein
MGLIDKKGVSVIEKSQIHFHKKSFLLDGQVTELSAAVTLNRGDSKI